MDKANTGKTFKVSVKDGAVKCAPMKHILHERKYEIFEVQLKKDTAVSYELLPLHFETNPRNAFKGYEMKSWLIELHDDNQRDEPGQEECKFSIGVQEKKTPYGKLFLDPTIVNQ